MKQKRAGRGARWAVATTYLLAITALLIGPLPGFLEAALRGFGDDLEQPFSATARGEFQYIKAHLQRPVTGYPRGVMRQVTALSHMACGLMNVATVEPQMKDELSPLLGEIVHRALSPQVSPYGKSPEDVTNLGSHGLYLSHLNLILGCYRHVSGDRRYDDLHHRISAHLAAGSLADGDFHIRSYPKSAKWPADQTVTLCSLYLYDKIYQADLSTAPIEGWLSYMKEHAVDPATQLPRSSISSSLSYAPIPRGCALSWSVLYMAQFAPDEAAQLYQRYRSGYFKTILGCGGFREWPPDRGQGADGDSGPIVFGIGVAASGLGVGPARLFKDHDGYTEIMRAASVCGLPTVLGGERKYRLAPLVGEAILFHGTTATPWFDPVPKLKFGSQPSFPTGPVVLSLAVLLLVAFLAWRFVRLVR